MSRHTGRYKYPFGPPAVFTSFDPGKEKGLLGQVQLHANVQQFDVEKFQGKKGGMVDEDWDC